MQQLVLKLEGAERPSRPTDSSLQRQQGLALASTGDPYAAGPWAQAGDAWAQGGREGTHPRCPQHMSGEEARTPSLSMTLAPPDLCGPPLPPTPTKAHSPPHLSWDLIEAEKKTEIQIQETRNYLERSSH